MIWPQHMHRTLRPPAAKVAPARPPSTWKVRRGRGAGAGGGGALCVAFLFAALCAVRRVGFCAAFYLNSEPQTAAPGRGRSPARQPDDILAQTRTQEPRDETRPGTPRDLRPRSNSHMSAHVDARDLHTVATRTCKWHNAQTRTAHGDQTRTNHHQLKRPQPWDNRTVVSTSVSVTPQARTGHPASK